MGRGIGDDVIRPLKNALDDLPVHVRQLGEMFRSHGRNQRRNNDGVTEIDTFDGRPDAPSDPGTHRPGFNPDGTVDPDAFRTPRDGAYYWSGMYPRSGQDIAGAIAADNNATTLEMLIDSRGIEMPEWDAENPASVQTWTQVSEAYAAGASGTVRAVLGDNIRSDAVWWTELGRLQANENVTQVIRVDPDTLVETVIWPA